MIRRVLLLLFLFPSICAVPKTKYQPVPMHLDHDGEKWAEKTLRKMSVEEKVGQLFMVWVRAEFLNAKNPEYAKLRDEINRYHVGSFAMSVPYEPPFLYKSGPYEAADLLFERVWISDGRAIEHVVNSIYRGANLFMMQKEFFVVLRVRNKAHLPPPPKGKIAN